jgi:hypothetical protein
MYLALQLVQNNNGRFLGLGLVAWIVIIIVVVAVFYFVSRGRRM